MYVYICMYTYIYIYIMCTYTQADILPPPLPPPERIERYLNKESGHQPRNLSDPVKITRSVGGGDRLMMVRGLSTQTR